MRSPRAGLRCRVTQEGRWTTITPSQFAHEREALAHVQALLPETEPYRAEPVTATWQGTTAGLLDREPAVSPDAFGRLAMYVDNRGSAGASTCTDRHTCRLMITAKPGWRLTHNPSVAGSSPARPTIRKRR